MPYLLSVVLVFHSPYPELPFNPIIFHKIKIVHILLVRLGQKNLCATTAKVSKDNSETTGCRYYIWTWLNGHLLQMEYENICDMGSLLVLTIISTLLPIAEVFCKCRRSETLDYSHPYQGY
jgi:hypothetical protein